jgi:hypothetical protein
VQAEKIRHLPLGVPMTLHRLFHFLVPPAPVPEDPLGEYLTQFRPIYEALILRNLRNVFVLPKMILRRGRAMIESHHITTRIAN